MLIERVEGKWVADFAEVFGLCKVKAGEVVAILSESQSRQVLVDLAELALAQMGAKVFHVRLPSPRVTSPAPLRSTGTTLAIGGLEPVVSALSQCGMVVDCTVEGMLHAAETRRILESGTRIFMVSNEHPEILERLKPSLALQEKCQRGAKMITEASIMRVSSAAGTSLTVDLSRTNGRGSAGIADRPGSMGYWPAGLCICFPSPGSVNGVIVLDEGDVNLTFKRYVESRVVLTVENDFVVDIAGKGLDADLMRGYYAAWNDPAAYSISHVGWGMAPGARWDALAMYDKRDTNGTELRAFAGNFLFSTGANETAGRYTACHFDYPMRHCTVVLDGQPVVVDGVVQQVLA